MIDQEPTMRRVRIEVKVVGCGVEEDVTQRIASFIAKKIAPVMPLAECDCSPPQAARLPTS